MSDRTRLGTTQIGAEVAGHATSRHPDGRGSGVEKFVSRNSMNDREAVAGGRSESQRRDAPTLGSGFLLTAPQMAPNLMTQEFFPYACSQILGGCIGTLVAHGMFELPLFELAMKARTGPAQWFAEFIATFGLIITILAVSRFKSEAIPVAVGLYITAAYWFTASTSFANPAVTIARALTNSFSGIAPADVPMFIVAQLAGALVGLVVMRWFFATSEQGSRDHMSAYEKRPVATE